MNNSQNTTIKLTVRGMSCGHCVAHVKRALEAVPGVVSADVSLEASQATVSGNADPAALKQAVRDAGYEAE